MSLARAATLLAAAAIVFLTTVAVGLKVLPQPHSETDFLVVGSIATLLTLVILFVVILSTWLRSSDTFFKKRPKGSSGEGEQPSNVE